MTPDYVHLGNDVTFKCLVEGDDRATVRWERGEGRLPLNAYVSYAHMCLLILIFKI